MKVRLDLAVCCVIIFSAYCVAQTGQQAAGTVVLKAGTELKLRFAQNVDSKTAVVGDPVELVLHEDLQAGGRLVAKNGLRTIATVREGKQSEKKRKPAKRLVIELDSLMLSGKPVPITGSFRGKAKTDAGDVVAGGLVFGLSGVLAVLSSRHVTIKEGTVISAYVASDVEVEALPSPAENERPQRGVGRYNLADDHGLHFNRRAQL